MLPALLENVPGIKEEPEQTAILLADENQLLPVLHSLPDWIDKVNITMGYGLVQSPLYSLMQTIIRIQESLWQNKGRSVYYQPLLQLVQHPYLYQLPEAAEIAQTVLQKALVSIPASTWEKLVEPRLKKCLTLIQHPIEIISLIRDILEDHLATFVEGEATDLQSQLIHAAHAQLNRLEDLLIERKEELSLSFISELILQVMRSQSVPLEGEPLRGLQIMGLLESRALDFKHIILLNVNEGILPKKAVAPTLIPDSIRRAYGLSVLENQDAIFAYVFYRLLQRSQSVYCLYNTAVDEKGMAEQSRFLTQIEYETGIPIIRKSVKMDINPKAKDPIVIEKDDAVMRTLNKYTGEEVIFSPSALNTYIDCRLRFYFQNLQGIREPEEREEEISPRVLGNFLHRAMEFLYKGLEEKKGNKWVEPGDFEWLNSQIDNYLKQALGLELAKDRNHVVDYTGTLRIVEEVVKIYIEEVLKQDKRWAPFEMVDQEWKIAHPVQLEVEGRRITIRLGGFIDRLDRKDGVYRIIDYKTGNDKKEFRSVQDLFTRDRTDRNKAALQTLLYAELLGKQLEQQPKSGTAPAWMQLHVGAARVQAGLYNVRQMRSEGPEFDWRLSENAAKTKLDDHRIKEIGPELMDSLQSVLSEIFTRDQPFDQTERREKCEYCPYQKICGR
jgi:CRISPR/Cas system-associated exonuclease Cas4 (RecB family)